MKIKDPDDIFIDPIIQFDQKHHDRRLYLAVILRALLDATQNKNDLYKKRAKAWFQCSVGVTCDNFEFICDHAGVEPGYVRSFAYEVINSDKQGVFRYHIYRMLRTTK